MGGFWELCWKMLAPRWCFFGYLGRCCGILAPRWRTRAPRRGKIGELRRRGLLLGGRDPCGGTRPPGLHPPKNGFSRMGLQTPTPTGTGSGKLEDWRTGGLENWKTGGLDYWAFGFTLYTQLCTKDLQTYQGLLFWLSFNVYIYLYIYIYMHTKKSANVPGFRFY